MKAMRIMTTITPVLIAVVAVMLAATPAASEGGAHDMKSGDARLAARIETALFADERVKARWVAVTASNGHVTLSGKVGSADASAAAEAIAWAIPGVTAVHNDLQLVAPEEGQTFASGRSGEVPGAVFASTAAPQWAKVH